MSGDETIAVDALPADPHRELPNSQSLHSMTPMLTPEAGSAVHDRAVMNGVLWQGSLRWLAQALSWSATIVIARKLSPEDYGVVGSATVLVGLLMLVTEGGLGRSLVVQRERDDVVIRQAHGASIALGLALAVVMLLAAYPLSRFYGEPRIAPMIASLSLVLVFSGMNAIPIALMQQRLAYRRLAAVDLAKAVVQGAVVMTGALFGYGAWALDIQSLAMLSHHVLSATGYGAVSTRVNIAAAIVLPIAFYLAARFSGTLAVAGVWLIAQPVLTFVSLTNVRRAVELPIRRYFVSLRAPAVSSAIMAVVVFATDSMLSSSLPILRLIVMCFAGILAYTATFVLLYRDRLSAYASVWRSRA